MESIRTYYTEYVPSLIDLWSKYLAHEDVMTSHYAGPQKQSKDYDPEKKAYFGFEVEDPCISDNERVLFECFRDKVKVIHLYSSSLIYSSPESKELEYGEEHMMTHENCLAYLAQLPRSWHSFCSK